MDGVRGDANHEMHCNCKQQAGSGAALAGHGSKKSNQ